jgi:hypothetical protein
MQLQALMDTFLIATHLSLRSKIKDYPFLLILNPRLRETRLGTAFVSDRRGTV